MSVLAAIRPDDWNWALLTHVGGAMILVGGTLMAVTSLALARGNVKVLRAGYWSLLIVALPGFIMMRIGAEWISAKWGLERYFDEEGTPVAAWGGVGYAVGDFGLFVFVLALAVGGVGVFRLRSGKGEGLLKATMVLSIVLLASYVVAIWAMSAKPE